MITDLFSHKIHSSSDEWVDKLVELAFLFSEFDGQIYDREKIEKRLRDISPRSVYASRDPSKFRDEISAYPAYLGLYKLSASQKGWIIQLTNATKDLLVKEEPDVASFLRLQLSLFQYPNGMGAAYIPKTNKLRIQANARDKTLNFISKKIHLSPLRLICKSLIADAELRNVDLFSGFISFKEVFVLSNSADVNKNILPSIHSIKDVLIKYRDGQIDAPTKFERRFHILKHTDLFNIQRGGISFRIPMDELDKSDLSLKIETICKIDSVFNGLDNIHTGDELQNLMAKGEWGTYFDGKATLNGKEVSILCSDIIDSSDIYKYPEIPEVKVIKSKIPATYPMKVRQDTVPSPKPSNRKAELADPEVTKIKRQRRNLIHKLLIDKMYLHLKSLGAKPMENPHIDLFADIPNDGSFIFEMKSGGGNLLDQIRKGISQLYEYRFRYNNTFKVNPTLCLVLPENPKEIPWLHEYLCVDRDICLCWFGEDDSLVSSDMCQQKMEVLIGDQKQLS